MSDAPRLRLALAWLSAAVILGGCMTHHVRPQVSQAVLDARAHRNAPSGPVCPQSPLADVSPVMVGFPFDASALTEDVSRPLAAQLPWLACHPATPIVVKPDSDGHGAPVAQDALARARAEAVQTYLTAHGLAAERVRILRRSQAEPAGEHVLIRAEGRRW